MRTIIEKPLVVRTGKFTGRSPQDRYFVKTEKNKNIIDWGKRNIEISEKTFEILHTQLEAYLTQQINFEYIGNVISDFKQSYEVSILTEKKWYTQFAKNIFRKDNFEIFLDKIKILHAPNFISKQFDDLKHNNFVIIHLEKKIILIAGTGYAGEIKKSVFSLLNVDLFNKNIFSMHCSANYDEKNSTTLYFGLSGTGKTTLSSDSSKQLIGDDEHGWSKKGIFNIEGGCYAKVAGLDQNTEPEIFKSTMHPSTVIENVVFDNDNNINFNDTSITENTRSCYSLDTIDNVYQEAIAPHPKNIIMLSCDAFGVLPPIARLSTAQAIYHFLSGFTSKVAGTENGINEPQPTFSTCFGAPFMPRRPEVYGNLLRQKIADNQAQCWLVNTGWTGGEYGTGSRMPIQATRALLSAALDGSLGSVNYRVDKFFGFEVPESVNGVPDKLLNPRDTWENKEAYDDQVHKLITMFNKNFKQYLPHVEADVCDIALK